MTRDQYIGITEQSKASKHRLDDAWALFHAVRWRGAMYMAGYSIECLLKAKLMEIYNCRHLYQLEDELQRRGMLAANTTVFTHQLEMLLRLAQARDRLQQNRTLWRQFNTVNRWMPAWRYTANRSSRTEAQNFLEAIEKILDWINHNV
jgi:HEPN domain-containing protein